MGLIKVSWIERETLISRKHWVKLVYSSQAKEIGGLERWPGSNCTQNASFRPKSLWLFYREVSLHNAIMDRFYCISIYVAWTTIVATFLGSWLEGVHCSLRQRVACILLYTHSVCTAWEVEHVSLDVDEPASLHCLKELVPFEKRVASLLDQSEQRIAGWLVRGIKTTHVYLM